MNNSRGSLRSDSSALAILGVAAALRIALWLQQRSLWIDEARLGLNIASRSYLSLLLPLDYNQSGPPFFLWIERFVVAVFGVSEAALRLPALVAGIATVALIYPVTQKLFGRRAALLAMAMSAVSPTLIHFSSEVKQYAVEACCSCAVMYLGLRWLDEVSNPRRWLAMVAMGGVAAWLALPIVFVLASAGLAVLLAPGLGINDRFRRTGYLALSWGGSFAVAYQLVYHYARDDAYLRHYWEQAFLTPAGSGSLLDTLVALRAVLWGPLAIDSMIGVANLATVVFVPAVSIAIALVLGIGVRRLVRTVGQSGRVIVLGPLLLALLASTLKLYPISARTMMFYLPTLIALAAAGVEECAGRIRSPLIRWAVIVAACLPLARIAYGELTNPDPREHLRPLVASLRARRQPEEPVYIFAGAIPAWAMYTTDWKSPDMERLDYLRRIAGAGGPAFENAPSRGRAVRDEGSGLTYHGPLGLEVYGIPGGLEFRVFGLTNPVPDVGWSENEARRIRQVANPGVWLIFSHFYGPEGILLRALEAMGAQLEYSDFRDGAALVHYAFPT